MLNLDESYIRYVDTGNTTEDDGPTYYWDPNWSHYPAWQWTYPSSNSTEQAYNILKALVEKKIIPTPKSFKKFTELMDAIKEAV